MRAFSPRTDFATLLGAMNALPQKRDELRTMLELLITALRDVIVKEASDLTPMLFFVDQDEFSSFTDALTVRRAVKIQRIITEAISDIDKNILIPTLLTDISVKIHGIR
jgi:hypothetical protein